MCVGITVIVESTDSLSVDVGADAFMWLLVDLSRCENLNSSDSFHHLFASPSPFSCCLFHCSHFVCAVYAFGRCLYQKWLYSAIKVFHHLYIPLKSLRSVRFFLNICIQQGCIKLFKSDSKYIYNMWPCTKNTVLSRWGIFVAIANNTLNGSEL